MFEPFVTTAGNRGGTGLGLAILRALAEGLGGSVELGDGVTDETCFVLRLPGGDPPAS